MIGRITGTLLEVEDDHQCIVDVQGVGYELRVSTRTAARLQARLAPHELLPPDESGSPQQAGGRRVSLTVHTHVREDAITLFGFEDAQERAVFRLLLSVSGVGPRMALAVLGAVELADLQKAVAAGDGRSLRGISGVGKKTIERILLELKDKLLPLGISTAAPTEPSPRSADPARQSVFGALVQLGYRPAEAERAVDKLPHDEHRVEHLLRAALASLA